MHGGGGLIEAAECCVIALVEPVSHNPPHHEGVALPVSGLHPLSPPPPLLPLSIRFAQQRQGGAAGARRQACDRRQQRLQQVRIILLW